MNQPMSNYEKLVLLERKKKEEKKEKKEKMKMINKHIQLKKGIANLNKSIQNLYKKMEGSDVKNINRILDALEKQKKKLEDEVDKMSEGK